MLRRDVLLAGALWALPRVAFAEADVAGEVARDDAVARWLAGIVGPPGLPPSNEWLAYAAAEGDRWVSSAPRVRAMEDWSRRELATLIPHDRPLVYPFGGPDALHALALFGDFTRLTLIGLEPVVAVPDWSGQRPARYFTDLGAAMADLHRLTFFRTRELQLDMSRVGVLPPLMATIVRMGGHVTRVSLPAIGRVSIEWKTADDRARTLDYAQMDLSNGGLAAHTEFVASLRALAPYVTFIKAASYLLRESNFSYIRRALLEDSAALVQDDTGLPFHELRGRWSTRLFGRYVAPDSPFQDRVQPELEAAFAHPVPAPLPFGIGYHVQPQRSNLLVGVRIP